MKSCGLARHDRLHAFEMMVRRMEYCFMSIVVLLLLVLLCSSTAFPGEATTSTGNGFTGRTTSSQKGIEDTDHEEAAAYNYAGDYDYYRQHGDVPSPGVGHRK
ncbi:hypothetical protein ACLB2K_074884 [Fragaria x ananassa]